MTTVQNLSCSQSSLFWESFQTVVCCEDGDDEDEEAHQHLSSSSSKESSTLLTSFASISRVLGIIESAEDLMFSSTAADHHDLFQHDDDHVLEDLEPIPIGPNGIQTIISVEDDCKKHDSGMMMMISEDCRHPAISMPTFLDLKNHSIVSTDSESLLESFIHTMKREAESSSTSCSYNFGCQQDKQPLSKKQKTMRTTISADTTTSSSSSVSAPADTTMMVVTTPVVSSLQEGQQGEEQDDEDHHHHETEDDTTMTMTNHDSMNDNGGEEEPARFRRYQADQWMERFEDLVKFKVENNGHCLVPHSFPPNQQLAQWVKRQRYQYKLKMLGRHSTLTDERQEELEQMGFVWDSHKAAWEERLQSLKKYCAMYGNCMVPTNYEEDRALAVWVKCQRRQMKLFQSGRRSTMTQERFEALDRLGFEWNPRNL